MSVGEHFRELRVYREAFESAMQIFDHSNYEKVSGGLVNMMANADPWCITSNQVREDGVEYEVTEDLTYPRTHTPTHPQTRGRTTNSLQARNETMMNPATGAEFLTERNAEEI